MFTKSARFYDAIYTFKDYAAEAVKVDALIQERKPGARTLLDVACGTGLHLEHLRERYEVEGLDLDPQLLAIARERLPGVSLHEGDILDFDLGRRFDTVVCLFSSIGYARTVENLQRAVARMAGHLEDGGVLVIEPWLTPDGWEDGHLGAVFVDEPDLKIASITASAKDACRVSSSTTSSSPVRVSSASRSRTSSRCSRTRSISTPSASPASRLNTTPKV